MVKVKQKTHKGTAKRFKITATGKIKCKRAGGGHLMSGKSAKQQRRVTGSAVITGKAAQAIRTRIAKNK